MVLRVTAAAARGHGVGRGAAAGPYGRAGGLRNGHFAPRAVIEFLHATEADALARDEALLNRCFPKSRAVAVCRYDRTEATA